MKKYYFYSICILLIILSSTRLLLVLREHTEKYILPDNKTSYYEEYLRPFGGEHAITKRAINIINYIRSLNIEDYWLSEKILSDMEVYQRVVEASWPIKPVKGSKNIIMFNNESNNKNCIIKNQFEGLKYVVCNN